MTARDNARHAARRLGPVLATAGALIVASPASPAAAEASIEATAGVDRFLDPGEHVVVEVTVTADRLVRGRLVATLPGAGGTYATAQDVEVAGGSQKVVRLVLATSPYDLGAIRVTLRGDGVDERAEVTLRSAVDTEIVGVLPRLVAAAGDLPATTALAVDAGTARLAPIDPDVAALGPAALDVYDTIAGLSGDLADLAPAAQVALSDWIQRGGRLVLDDDGDPSTLPAAWRPGPAGYAFAGDGEVRYSAGLLARGGWDQVIEPNVVAVFAEDGGFSRGTFEQTNPVSVSLVRASGLGVPGLGWVLGVLLAYVLVVGPAMYLVLRHRRRLTAAWLTVPAIALLTTGVVVVAGGRLRSDAEIVASGVVEHWDGGSRATLNVLAVSRDGGDAGARLADGWAVHIGTDFQSIPVVQEGTGEGAMALATLAPGQAAVLGLAGPTGDRPGIEVTATSGADGAASGTVRNTLDVPLTDVAVFVREVGVLVGTLAPGQERTWQVENATERTGTSLASQVWSTDDGMFGVAGGPFIGGGPVVVEAQSGQAAPRSQQVDLPAWGAWAVSRSTTVRLAGTARAVGWVAGEEAPLRDQSGGAITATLAHTASTPVVPDGAVPSDVTIRGTLVRGPYSMFGPNEQGGLVRFVLPPGSRQDVPYELDLATWAGAPAVWAGGAWAPLDAPSGGTVAVPPEAVHDGVVHFRFQPVEVGDLSDVLTLRAVGGPA